MRHAGPPSRPGAGDRALRAGRARAGADPEPLRLTFHGAAGCPDVDAFREMVAAGLGGKDPFVREAPQRLDVRVRQIGAAVLHRGGVLYDAAGKPTTLRTEQHGRTCAGAVGMVAALAAEWWMPVVVGGAWAGAAAGIGGAAGAGGACSCGAGGAGGAAGRSGAAGAAGARAAAAVEVPDRAGVWADRISNDGDRLGLTFDAGVRRGWISGKGEAQWDPALGSTLYSTGRSPGDLRFARVTGALLLCGNYEWLVGCLKGQAGQILFTGSVPSRAAQIYAAAGLRLGLEFPVAPSWFFLHPIRSRISSKLVTAVFGRVDRAASGGGVALEG